MYSKKSTNTRGRTGASSHKRSSSGSSFGGHRTARSPHAGGSSFTRRGRSQGSRFGGSGRGGRGGGRVERIDYSRFVNKAVITEETVHFVAEHAFRDFKIEEQLKAAIAVKGFETPTPIQDRSIPHILNGEDVVGIANTGTGKTGAFLIPLINKILLDKRQKGLIIVPTRELAIQIDQELKALTPRMGVFSVCCVGGAPIGRQISGLRRGYSFVIGTPGRLKDLIDRRVIDLAQFNTLVLDEADRMLDMGFIGDMRFVVARMPKERHTLFFSATLSSEIERLISEFLREPVRISVKTGDTAKNVEQDIIKVTSDKKLDVLHDLLNNPEFSKVLIFGRTKHGVEKLSRILAQKGFKAESIHGDKNHSKRQRALGLFKDNHVQVLVATDVAARGLDIADVSHVINYDLPATYDDYVHRIGRTGRGNKRGKAFTFIER